MRTTSMALHSNHGDARSTSAHGPGAHVVTRHSGANSIFIWVTLLACKSCTLTLSSFWSATVDKTEDLGVPKARIGASAPGFFHVFHLSWLYVIWICMPLWTAAGCEVSCFGELVPCCVGSFVLSFCCFASTLDRDDSDLLCQGGVAGLHYR